MYQPVNDQIPPDAALASDEHLIQLCCSKIDEYMRQIKVISDGATALGGSKDSEEMRARVTAAVKAGVMLAKDIRAENTRLSSKILEKKTRTTLSSRMSKFIDSEKQFTAAKNRFEAQVRTYKTAPAGITLSAPDTT